MKNLANTLLAVSLIACGHSSGTGGADGASPPLAEAGGMPEAGGVDGAVSSQHDAGVDGSATVAKDAGADASEPLLIDASAPDGSRSITFVNACAFTVWVGELGNSIGGSSCSVTVPCPANQACNTAAGLCSWTTPNGGGFELNSNAEQTVFVPTSWGGRFWPRTLCSGFNTKGVPACATGDCGGNLGCPVGVGGAPPATLAEFTLVPAATGTDFYDVSAVDGTNIPVSITPIAGTFNATPPGGASGKYWCTAPGCTTNCGPLSPCVWGLETSCPVELQEVVDGGVVGCRSANQACAVDPSNAPLACSAERDLYGCTSGGPNNVSGSCYSKGATSTCCGCPSWSAAGDCQSDNPAWETPSRPETYAKVFKDACPSAYSFPYDDKTSTFTCKGQGGEAAYVVTFCP